MIILCPIIIPRLQQSSAECIKKPPNTERKLHTLLFTTFPPLLGLSSSHPQPPPPSSSLSLFDQRKHQRKEQADSELCNNTSIFILLRFYIFQFSYSTRTCYIQWRSCFHEKCYRFQQHPQRWERFAIKKKKTELNVSRLCFLSFNHDDTVTISKILLAKLSLSEFPPIFFLIWAMTISVRQLFLVSWIGNHAVSDFASSSLVFFFPNLFNTRLKLNHIKIDSLLSQTLSSREINWKFELDWSLIKNSSKN